MTSDDRAPLKPLMTDPSRRRRDLLLLALAALVFLGVGLGVRDLWNPNEPTYGRVVVEMIESGDWLIPRLNGEPFAEKPILYYWLAAGVSVALGDVSAVSLRIPVLAAGVLAVLLVYLLIEAYDGRRRALIGSALFATLYVVWFTARNAQMDSFVVLSTLGVLVPLSRRLDHGMGGLQAGLLAGIAAGLGFAAKGPVAVLVPGMVLLLYLVVGRRPWRRLLSGLPLGLVAFAALASPWYVALWLDGQTEALSEMLIRQNVSRFVDAWDHLQPWWYYLKYFGATFAPWSWFVPIAAISALRRQDDDAGPGNVLAWIWLLAPLVFFSLSQSKREPYVAPVAPAVAWLVAGLFDRLWAGRLPRWQARACVAVTVAVGVTLLLAGVWAAVAFELDEPELEAAKNVLLAAILTVAAIILVVALLPRTRRAAPAGLWAAFAMLYVFLATYGHGAANPVKSHRPIAADLEKVLPPGSSLYSYFGRYRLVRGGYPFYLGRSVPDLADEESLRGTWAADERPCVLYEEAKYRPLVEGLPAARVLLERRVGSNTVRLVCADRAQS